MIEGKKITWERDRDKVNQNRDTQTEIDRQIGDLRGDKKESLTNGQT
jgi:hypothetical protein